MTKIFSGILLFMSTLFALGQNDTAYINVFGDNFYNEIIRIEPFKSTNFIGIGNESNNENTSNIFVITLDSNLNPIKKYSIGTEFIERAQDFIVLPDNKVYIGGITNAWGNGNYDSYFAILDSNFNLIDEYTVGHENWDNTISVHQLSDFSLFGISNSLDNQQNKLLILSTYFNSSSISFDTIILNSSITINDCIVDSNNNIFCAGHCIENNQKNYYLVAYDSEGNFLWEDCSGSNEDESLNQIVIIDKTVYSVGYSYELLNYNKDYLLVSYNLDGTKNFKTIPNYYIEDDDEAFFISKTKKGLGILAGTKSIGNSPGLFDLQFIETNMQGSLIDGYNYGWNREEIPCNFLVSEKGFYLIGNTNSIGNGYEDFFVIEIDSNYSKGYLNVEYISINNIETDFILNIGENNEIVRSYNEILEVRIFSLNGKLIYLGKVQFGNYSNIPSGVYIIQYIYPDNVISKKIFIYEN